MRPNASTKNGQKGAHGFNCRIFVNFETVYEIYDKNYSSKKNLMSLRRFWFFCLLITWDISVFLTCWGWLGRFNFQIERDLKSLKSFWRCAEVFLQFSSFWASFAENFTNFFSCVSLIQRSRKHTCLRLLRQFSNKLIRK